MPPTCRCGKRCQAGQSRQVGDGCRKKADQREFFNSEALQRFNLDTLQQDANTAIQQLFEEQAECQEESGLAAAIEESTMVQEAHDLEVRPLFTPLYMLITVDTHLRVSCSDVLASGVPTPAAEGPSRSRARAGAVGAALRAVGVRLCGAAMHPAVRARAKALCGAQDQGAR